MTVKRFIEDNITLLVMGPHGPLEYRDHLNQQGNGTTYEFGNHSIAILENCGVTRNSFR